MKSSLRTFLIGAMLCGHSAFAATLFQQVVQSTLNETASHFPHRERVHWLLLQADTGEMIASNWQNASTAVPVGSLTKPFLAFAYLHSGKHATIHPQSWSGQTDCGPAPLTIERALAFSCNGYFLGVAQTLGPSDLQRIAQLFVLPLPPSNAAPQDLIGLTTRWKIAPIHLAQSYARLLQMHDRTIETGMRLAASTGTARALHGHNVLAKTGTATCDHCRNHGNGFVLVAAPAAHPRFLLLMEAEGTTGGTTATFAQKMITQLESLHAW